MAANDAGRVAVAGNLRPLLTVEWKDGKLRTKTIWVMPPESPTAPATLTGFSGLKAYPTPDSLDADLYGILGKPGLSVNLTLDQQPGGPAPPTPPPAPAARPAAAPAAAPAATPQAKPAGNVVEAILTIEVQGDEGEPPGMDLTDNMVVAKIRPQSPVEGKLMVGDVIKSVNKVKMTSKDHFVQIWSRVMPDASIEVLRRVVAPPAGAKAAPGPSPSSRAPAAAPKAAAPPPPAPAPAAPAPIAAAPVAAAPVAAAPPPVAAAPAGGAEGGSMNIEIQAEEGEPPGISLDEKLMVTKIIPGSVMEGKVELGDVIISLNKIKVGNKGDFWNRWNRALPSVTLEVNRSKDRQASLKSSLLPEDVEKLIMRKADHDYSIKMVDCGSKPLGLGLETLVNKVVVIRIVPGSAGAEMFKQWDTLSAVDRIRVSDANVAKHLIRDRSGKFEALIERPMSKETHAGLEKALQFKRNLNMANESEDWAMFAGPPDVQAILVKAIPGRKGITPARPIWGPKRVPSKTTNVAVREQPTETQIVSDIDPKKNLRKVPKG